MIAGDTFAKCDHLNVNLDASTCTEVQQAATLLSVLWPPCQNLVLIQLGKEECIHVCLSGADDK